VGAVISSVKRQSEYQGYRTGSPDRPVTINSMPILIGAALIAGAILLSTLVTALGTRYLGFEGPTEESAWLIDRLTGSIYRCEAPTRGKASCISDIATGSIPAKPKP
jgi:hypothetical protein